MTTIRVSNATISYDDVGTGPPVLLIHAGIADRRMWRAQVAALRDRHRVIAMDLRGYGESDLPATAFAHHDDVIGLLDALGVARAALVGCSFGGAVAIDVAIAHPDRVTALALFGSALGGHDWSDATEQLWDDLVGAVDPEDLDVTYLMFDMQRRLDTSVFPDGETVLSIGFPDLDTFGHWWLVCSGADVDLCYEDPGKDVDCYVTAASADLIAVWMGDRSLRGALESGAIGLVGDSHLTRSFPKWFARSAIAGVPRPETGLRFID